jgi:ADP-dependent phosphofructokinase/glucokinase
MPAQAWIDRYEYALDRARLRIKYDRNFIACGFTNNVDYVVTLDDALLAKLIAHQPVSIDGPRESRADSPEQLVRAILQSVALGEGIDLPVAEPPTQAWLIDQASGRYQLGGSSAQVANTLSLLGVSTRLHLTGNSPVQAESGRSDHDPRRAGIHRRDDIPPQWDNASRTSRQQDHRLV